jgi:hypothetical protein
MARVPWRREFDPGAEFVCRKPVTVGGRKFAPGETFDHTLIPTRRLRQLFDQHTIIFKGDTPGKLIRNFRRNPELEAAAPPSVRHSVRENVAALSAGEGRQRPTRPPAAASEPKPPPATLEPLTPEEEEAARLAALRRERASVVIPQDWEHQPWNFVRALAKQLTDEPVKDKETGLRVIAEEIAHRAGTS